jgi:ParB family transcriptional regulator, chromosome partitioning protein
MAAENAKKEERVEKRRALGRGLESLLPGPRVVRSTESRAPNGGQTPSQQSTTETPSVGISTGEAKAFPVSVGATAVAVAPASGAHEIEVERTGVSTSPSSTFDGESIEIQAAAIRANEIASLDIALIEKNPYQTRYVFDEEKLAEMRDSIKEHGVMQPIIVRPGQDEGRYILVLGERRLRAAKMAGKQSVPAIIRKVSLQQAAEMTVLENVARQDLNPLEQAEAYRVLSQEFRLTQAQIAQRLGVSRESVSNYMRLLRLPDEIKEYVAHGRIGFSEARELLALENPEHILQVAEDLLLGRLRFDELKERVVRLNANLPPVEKPAGAARWVDPNVRAAQMDMERTLGMRVKIQDRNGKGKIVIEYASVDDYEKVVQRLREE